MAAARKSVASKKAPELLGIPDEEDADSFFHHNKNKDSDHERNDADMGSLEDVREGKNNEGEKSNLL